MSCLADSNLTAIREGRAADLLAEGRQGGSESAATRRCLAVGWGWGRGGGGVIYATLYTSTSGLGVCVCVVHMHPCSGRARERLLITSFYYIQLSLRLNCPALIFCSPTCPPSFPSSSRLQSPSAAPLLLPHLRCHCTSLLCLAALQGLPLI